MRRTVSFAVIVLVLISAGAALHGQTPAPASQAPAAPVALRPMDPAKLRRNIYVMEGHLARAVEFGAKDLNRKIRSAMPDVMALSGHPQARGVYLEGYGVYFDVAVPVLNQVMMWSLRTMLGPDDELVNGISQLRSHIQSEKNPTIRATLEKTLARMELQLGPRGAVSGDQVPAVRPTPGTSGAALLAAPPANVAAAPNAEPTLDRRALQDPNYINRLYTESVQNAIIEALTDQALMFIIKPDEYLTVAARDNMLRDSFAPLDPFEEVVTILLRLKGSDLAALRAGQIDQAELRKRVEVREF